MTSDTKKAVLNALKNRAVNTGIEVKLASGKISNIYVDSKKLTLHGPSLDLVSKLYCDFLFSTPHRAKSVAGVSVGGDPLVAGVILEAHRRGIDVEGLLVRKETKSHGLSQGRAVEGAKASPALYPLWLLEDVVSTGKSSLEAIRNMKKEGYQLQGLLCLVDREMGGLESVKKEASIEAVSLFKLSELEV